MTLQQSNNIHRTAVAKDSHDSDLLHKKTIDYEKNHNDNPGQTKTARMDRVLSI